MLFKIKEFLRKYDLDKLWWIVDRIEALYYNIYYGFSNIRKFGKVFLRFRTWDHGYLLEIIEILTKEMSLYHKYESPLMFREKTAKQLLIVSTLARRLREANYFNNAGYASKNWLYFSNKQKHLLAQHAIYMERQDAAYLAKMMRYICHWWS